MTAPSRGRNLLTAILSESLWAPPGHWTVLGAHFTYTGRERSWDRLPGSCWGPAQQPPRQPVLVTHEAADIPGSRDLPGVTAQVLTSLKDQGQEVAKNTKQYGHLCDQNTAQPLVTTSLTPTFEAPSHGTWPSNCPERPGRHVTAAEPSAHSASYPTGADPLGATPAPVTPRPQEQPRAACLRRLDHRAKSKLAASLPPLC